ncbi:MAG: hypothetical protein AUG49_02435 [Catenulispora sp. 13_1_20CM_3_70_7]|nr:MAG: hypothetical protein AUG49_02435 [Catenulispora sp. 13_1_20CM_3_70_7]
MTDSPKGQDAPDQEVDADLLAELAASFGAPRAVPARAARGGGVVTDDVKDVSDADGAAGSQPETPAVSHASATACASSAAHS